MFSKSMTSIRLNQFFKIKNCSKNDNCFCSNKLRYLLLKIPIDNKEESKIDLNLVIMKNKYDKCFLKNYKL